MTELLAQMAYQSASQALAQQEAALNELRSRTGTLLAADAITASFLGAAALKDGTLDTLGALALLCFALSLGSALFILLPRKEMRFSLSGPAVYERLYEHRDDPEEMQRRLAYWLEEFWAGNQRTIEGLYPYFTAATVLLAVQLVLWAVDLRTTL